MDMDTPPLGLLYSIDSPHDEKALHILIDSQTIERYTMGVKYKKSLFFIFQWFHI